MELVHAYVPRDCKIFETSCSHLGSATCFKEGIREFVARVGSKRNHFWTHKGDWIEAIMPKDKRWMSQSIDKEYMTPQLQADAAIEIYKPIAKRLLVGNLGNHEWTLLNGGDWARYICQGLNAPYGGIMCKVILHDTKTKEVMFKIFSWHGRGVLTSNAQDPIQAAANRAARARLKLIKTGHADCAVMSMGHFHDALWVTPPTSRMTTELIDIGGKIKQVRQDATPPNAQRVPPDSRWFAVVGCLRKGVTDPGSGIFDYGEMGGFGPASLGWVEWTIQDGKIVKGEAVEL